MKPRILLLGFNDTVTSKLDVRFGTVELGFLGRSYRVPPRNHWVPLDLHARGYQEQEIILVNLEDPEPATVLPEKMNGVAERDWWTSAGNGILDSTFRGAAFVRSAFSKIYEHGGVFVVLAQPQAVQTVIAGYAVNNYLHEESKFEVSNYGFVDALRYFSPEFAVGNEVKSEGNQTPWQQFATRHIGSWSYMARFTDRLADHSCEVLLRNKFDEIVGAVFTPRDRPGHIAILPYADDLAPIVNDLLNEVLPTQAPHLFPTAHVADWLNETDLQSPRVVEVRSKLASEHERHTAEDLRLRSELASVTELDKYRVDILSSTGPTLVTAVREVLVRLGVEATDSDTQEREAAKTLQEDLRIGGADTPLLLVEVKGLEGFPREHQTLQVDKYVMREMRSRNDPTIQGLAIINAQRRIDPRMRSHEKFFTSQQIADAADKKIGLLSTWELFLMLQGVERNLWAPRDVQGLFRRVGLIKCEPGETVGRVTHVYPKSNAISVSLEGPIRCGDSLILRKKDGFLALQIKELQQNKKTVNEATTGSVGVSGVEAVDISDQNGAIVCRLLSNVGK